MSKSNLYSMNLSTLLSCVTMGMGIGFLAALTSMWFSILIVIPLCVAYFVGELIYKHGALENAMQESQARVELLEKLIDIVDGEEKN